jgi:hypothetical protein
MSEPLILVVLFATTPDPTAETLISAAKTALGSETVVLADPSAPQSEESALSIGERAKSWAVARVSWADSTYLRATLHVRVASSSEWRDEELRFGTRDLVPERGRTLGYALASMVQRIAQSEAAVTANVADGGAPGSDAAPPLGVTSEARDPGPPEARPSPAPPDHGIDRKAATGGERGGEHLGAIVVGTGALGDGATSAGAKAGLEWWPVMPVSLRAAAGVRLGTIAEARASTMTLLVSAGAGYHVPLTSIATVGLRADVVLLQHTVRRTDELETTRARWLGAADLMVEASFALTSRLGLTAAAGSELAFGTTTIRVAGREISEIPTVRGLGELGLRFRF